MPSCLGLVPGLHRKAINTNRSYLKENQPVVNIIDLTWTQRKSHRNRGRKPGGGTTHSTEKRVAKKPARTDRSDIEIDKRLEM